jgi:hypothetical protein
MDFSLSVELLLLLLLLLVVPPLLPLLGTLTMGGNILSLGVVGRDIFFCFYISPFWEVFQSLCERFFNRGTSRQ